MRFSRASVRPESTPKPRKMEIATMSTLNMNMTIENRTQQTTFQLVNYKGCLQPVSVIAPGGNGPVQAQSDFGISGYVTYQSTVNSAENFTINFDMPLVGHNKFTATTAKCNSTISNTGGYTANPLVEITD